MKFKTMRRVAALAIAALSATLLGVTAAQADVGNGSIGDSVDPWWSYGTSSLEAVDGALCATTSGANRWDAGVGQNGIAMTAGAKEIAFTVTGNGTFKVNVETPENTNVLGQEFTVNGTETFTYEFTAAETANGKVLFEVGGNAAGHTVCLDDISVTDVDETVEYLSNGTFDSTVDPWWSYGTSALEAAGGQMCATTTGANRWDAGVGTSGFAIDPGAKTVSFDVVGTGAFKVNVETPENTNVLGQEFTVDGSGSFTYDFTALETTNAKILFEVGGNATGHTVCFDNVSITGIAGGEEPEPEEPTLQGGVNLLTNGDFATGVAPWGPYGHTGAVEDGAYCASLTGPLTNPWDAGLGYNNLELPAGTYEFSFDASTTGTFKALVQQTGGSWTTFAQTDVTGTDLTHYELSFTLAAPVEVAAVQFQFGGIGETSYTACIDNVFLGAPSVEYVTNGTFDEDKAPWSTDGVSSWSVDSGALCVEVPGGTANPWDVNIHYDGMQLPAGPYTLTFKASGTGGPMRALVGLGASPYTVYTETNDTPSETLEEYNVYFTMNAASDNAQIAFQVGGSSSPWTFCIDDVSLASGGEAPPYAPETGPRVKVNQLGYVTGEPQRATLVTDAEEAVAWQLRDESDAVVGSGTTSPAGVDASSELNVHVIDFTGTYPAGTYTLVADDAASYPFTIGADIYEQLLPDALNYFYLVRSGIEIEEEIVGPDYARPAGHVSTAGGEDVNQGDYGVGCQPAEESLVVYGEAWTCDYTLDVVGGWYDAGDHGKYVVNGGIATAQLLGTYERALRGGPDAVAALADGSLDVPEHGNAIPDVLDEAKWELDFMMSMTVPEGEDLAGMVHHKVHDYGWTGLPLLPHNDAKVRYLHRPSTAATLNLAATAAQGARLFDDFDAEYSQELLDAAEVAWNAALAHPAIYATAADGANGGGPYDDDDVADEFYWAAAELYLTTGDAEYLEFLQESPVADANSFPVAGFSWDALGAIAKIDLATVPSSFPDRIAIADQVVAGAQAIAEVQQSQSFGQALAADDFVWGSNSSVLNNIVVLAAGYDLTGSESLRDAAYESMDYVLGRNALANSYITGYGTQYSQNQHSRWFAAQLNSELPHPPKGAVSGGPNTNQGTWDPTFAALYPAGDCAPQLCYVDDIQSWATNEITVNWNSALSAVAGFLTAPSAPVTLPDREFTAAPKPTIAGTNALGGVLTATAGAWSPEPTSLAYQWNRNGTPIAGAHSASYTIVAADSGAAITVSVTASKAGYAPTTKTSDAFVLSKYFIQTPKPTITGGAYLGGVLKANVGTWSPAVSSFAYQWYRNGVAISGAKSSTYTLVKADSAAKISVAVTASRTGFQSVTKTSSELTLGKFFTKAPKPTILGTMRVGQTVKAVTGTWSPTPTSFEYRWYRNGEPIAMANGSTYKLRSADAGKKITVQVTAKRSGYASTPSVSDGRWVAGAR